MKKHCKRHNSGSATQKLNDLGSHSSFEDKVQTNLEITDFHAGFFLCVLQKHCHSMVKQIRLSFNDTIAQIKLSAQLPDLCILAAQFLTQAEHKPTTS